MTPQRAKTLAEQIEQKSQATVEFEEVAPGRFRFAAISPRFSALGQLQRQDEVWELIDKVLTRDETLDISLVLTFAPDEIESIAPQ